MLNQSSIRGVKVGVGVFLIRQVARVAEIIGTSSTLQRGDKKELVTGLFQAMC